MENSIHSLASASETSDLEPIETTTANTQTAETNGRTPTMATETEPLNKIRSILFGEQAEQQNQRLQQLESQVVASYDQLRTETHQKIDAIEARLIQRLDDLSRRLEQATTGLHSTVNSVNQTLQQELQHQTLAVKNELDAQMNTVAEQLRSQINTQKVTDSEQRVHLSTLFGEISRKLGETNSQ
ncbi:MAG: hypothetical protein AAFQ63_16055 [Cyanobacteria bacterium J06621_11]